MTQTPQFATPEGHHVPAVTAEEMREVDRVAVEEIGLELLQMMENAGRTLAGFSRELTDEDVVVLAGAGGNGGGGLCAARHLANHGRDVRVLVDRSAETLTGAAVTQYRVLEGTHATTVGTDLDAARLDEAGLLVDAVVGYGLSSALRGRAAEYAAACNAAPTPTLSLDVPSGVNATTGERPGTAVDADHTLTLALPKTGLGGLSDLWLADIGIPREVYRRVGVDVDQPFGGEYRVRLV